MLGNPALTLLYFGYAVLGTIGLYLLFARAPRASVTLLLVLSVLEGSRDGPLPLSLSAASFNVTAFDLATVLFGLVAIQRRGWDALGRPARRAMNVVATLTALGLLTWTLLEGVQVSVNFWRIWMLSIAACWYAATWPALKGGGGTRPFVWAALLATAVQAYGIALGGFGSSSSSVVIEGEEVYARPIWAQVALLILFAFIIVALDDSRKAVVRWPLAAWLAISVVVSQHRSVWVSSIVAGTLIVVLLVRRSSSRPIGWTWAALGLGVLGLAALTLAQESQQVAESSSDDGTLIWRVENWAEKLRVSRSAGEWLVGSTFGPTPVTERFGSTLQFQVSSHNMYIDTVSALGVVGLLALGVICVTAVAAAHRGSIPAHGVFAASLVAYGVFYAWPAWVWLAVGASLVVGRVGGPSRNRLPTTSPATSMLPVGR